MYICIDIFSNLKSLYSYLMKMKVIVVTGWVLSGVGKWISWSSLGALLKACGYTVFMQKFDGYLNGDAGTINPFKHGECFVTEDGAETDLDIGHYERFLDADMNQMSIYTSGKLMQEIMEKERRGDYLGNDVQIIPHFTNLIKEKITLAYEMSGADISIVEVGGTVGDMENEAIVEAMRQLRQDLGYQNVIYVHLTYIPYLLASKELKTKPTQNSVKDLRMRGINPDFLICRADYEISDEILTKISYMTGVKRTHVIPAPTIDSIYRIPLDYKLLDLQSHLQEHFGLEKRKPDMTKRESLYNHIQSSSEVLRIAMVGKYVWLEDAYFSLNEALKVAGFYNNRKVKIQFIEAEELTVDNLHTTFEGVGGVCVPGWFGTRGVEGMILAAQFARENNIPYLWICLGSQIMAIEFARNVLKLSDATSEEFDPEHGSKNHVIHIMETQKSVTKKGGSMRLGTYPCFIRNGTKMYEMYVSQEWNVKSNMQKVIWNEDSSCILHLTSCIQVTERHRHRYEFNNLYREEFEKAWFLISGTSPDGNLVEMVELRDHPFMVATQAHPELKSRPTRPHPLFIAFISHCL
jgi:CTP synthase